MTLFLHRAWWPVLVIALLQAACMAGEPPEGRTAATAVQPEAEELRPETVDPHPEPTVPGTLIRAGDDEYSGEHPAGAPAGERRCGDHHHKKDGKLRLRGGPDRRHGQEKDRDHPGRRAKAKNKSTGPGCPRPPAEEKRPDPTPPGPDPTPGTGADLSWSDGMADIVEEHCEGCHNESRATAGIRLTSYGEFMAVSERALDRIEARTLTRPIPEDVRSLFLQWQDLGFPE